MGQISSKTHTPGREIPLIAVIKKSLQTEIAIIHTTKVIDGEFHRVKETWTVGLHSSIHTTSAQKNKLHLWLSCQVMSQVSLQTVYQQSKEDDAETKAYQHELLDKGLYTLYQGFYNHDRNLPKELVQPLWQNPHHLSQYNSKNILNLNLELKIPSVSSHEQRR